MPITLTMYKSSEVPKRCRQLGHSMSRSFFMDRYECLHCDLRAWVFIGHNSEEQIAVYNGPLLEQACPGDE